MKQCKIFICRAMLWQCQCEIMWLCKMKWQWGILHGDKLFVPPKLRAFVTEIAKAITKPIRNDDFITEMARFVTSVQIVISVLMAFQWQYQYSGDEFNKAVIDPYFGDRASIFGDGFTPCHFALLLQSPFKVKWKKNVAALSDSANAK